MSCRGWIRRNVAERSPEGLKCRRKVARRLESQRKLAEIDESSLEPKEIPNPDCKIVLVYIYIYIYIYIYRPVLSRAAEKQTFKHLSRLCVFVCKKPKQSITVRWFPGRFIFAKSSLVFRGRAARAFYSCLAAATILL